MRTINDRINRLPKWARARFSQYEEALKCKQAELDMVKRAHAVLFDYGHWFTIHGPPKECSTMDGLYHLFFLGHTGAHAACSLGPNDILLVGRRESKDDL